MILAPDTSKAVVIKPAADWTDNPAAKGSLVSLFLIKTNCAGGVAFAPSVKVNSVPPVPPAAVVIVNLSDVFKVNPIFEPVVEMVAPAA